MYNPFLLFLYLEMRKPCHFSFCIRFIVFLFTVFFITTVCMLLWRFKRGHVLWKELKQTHRALCVFSFQLTFHRLFVLYAIAVPASLYKKNLKCFGIAAHALPSVLLHLSCKRAKTRVMNQLLQNKTYSVHIETCINTWTHQNVCKLSLMPQRKGAYLLFLLSDLKWSNFSKPKRCTAAEMRKLTIYCNPGL